MVSDFANLDKSDQARFDKLATDWWDTAGSLKTLHAINPVRMVYIKRYLSLSDCQVIDVGCGGGLLSEAMAREGARVTGIDANEAAIIVAREHALNNNLRIDYQVTGPEKHAETHSRYYDLVTCMEMLEHVPDPIAVVSACARLLKPGGHIVFSTINRTVRAYAFAILGAEYLLNELPRGTHQYANFIRPAELNNWCSGAGMVLDDITGMSYLPLLHKATLVESTAVNYLAHGRPGS